MPAFLHRHRVVLLHLSFWGAYCSFFYYPLHQAYGPGPAMLLVATDEPPTVLGTSPLMTSVRGRRSLLLCCITTEILHQPRVALVAAGAEVAFQARYGHGFGQGGGINNAHPAGCPVE